jgi:hypothetical protein
MPAAKSGKLSGLPMILLDTDHLTELQFSGDRGDHLRVRLKASGQRPSISIISFEEQLRGWLAEINRAKGVTDQVRVYDRMTRCCWRPICNIFGWCRACA